MVLHSKKATRRHVMALGAAVLTAPAIRSAAGPDQDAGDRRLCSAYRCSRGNRPQRQQRLHHRRFLHQRRAGRRRDRRRQVQDRPEAVRRRQRSGARHDADPAPDRRGHQLLPGIVRLQHRAADGGDHRARQEADGADRRRLGRDLHPGLQVRLRHVPARHAAVRCDRGHVQVAAAPAADLFGDLDQRCLLQDRGRGRAALVRRGGLQAHRGLRAAGQADRRVERAGFGALQHVRTCWSASCTTRTRSWWRARWSPPTPT